MKLGRRGPVGMTKVPVFFDVFLSISGLPSCDDSASLGGFAISLTRYQTHVVGHLLDPLHLFFLHNIVTLLRRLLHHRLRHPLTFCLAHARRRDGCVAEEAAMLQRP